VGFLRRLRGNDPHPGPASGAAGTGPGDGNAGIEGAMSADEEEAARNRELMREESQRLEDELLQRQMRYADRSWTPPAQGGPRRAGDEESAAD
jgi:hypothetical protein